MRYIIRTLFSLILLIIIASTLLPNHYKVTKTVTSHCSQAQIEHWVFDLANWHLWTPWATYEREWQQLELVNSNKVGAYLKWQSAKTIGEMTVTQRTEDSLSYTSLIGQHTNSGTIKTKSFADIIEVTWTIEGGINAFLVAGLLTYHHKQKMNDAINLGLRNLNSLCKANQQGMSYDS